MTDNRTPFARRAAPFLALAAWVAFAPAAGAATPSVPLANPQVTLDGTPLGSAIAGRSGYPTIQRIGGIWHMWVQVQDGAASNLRIAGYRHATSTDGLAYLSQGTLSFAGDPFAATLYGSTFGEPPWIYPRASASGGGVTFQFWTYNTVPDVTGDYDYNLSINTIAAPDDLALTHYGPVGAVPANLIAAQTAGGFGLAGGAMYYDNNSSLGRSALALAAPGAFPATANTGPWYATGTNAAVYSPLPLLGYTACHLPGGDTYMHNAARVIDNGDGTLGFFFTLRNCDGSRKGSQIYYAESADDGLTWSAPVGLIGAAPTINGNALQPGFALADVVVANGQRVVFFNAVDANGNLVVGAAPPVPPGAAQPVPVEGAAALAAVALMLAGAVAAARRSRGRLRRSS